MTAHADFDFCDSVVLVTGGGSGIGLAIAEAFLGADRDDLGIEAEQRGGYLIRSELMAWPMR